MTYLEEISYSHEETVVAVGNYYTFLTKLYLPETAIIEPPPAGWPDIEQGLKCLNKTSEVLKLLSHLPYIHCPEPGNPNLLQAAAACTFADWSSLATDARNGLNGVRADGSRLRMGSEPWGIRIAPSIIGLTYWGTDNPKMLLDTRRGVVHWYECPSDIRDYYWSDAIEEDDPRQPISADPYGSDYDAEDQDEGDFFGACTTWSIVGFFAMLQDCFRRFYFLPVSPSDILEDYAGRFDSLSPERLPGLPQALREVYERHGWPDLEHYEKEKCLRAVRIAMAKLYPHAYELPKENLLTCDLVV